MYLPCVPLPKVWTCARWPCRLRLHVGAVLLSALFAGVPTAAEPVTITLLAFNDFHGHIQPPPGTVRVPDAANPQGSRVAAGGAAYLSALVQQIKARNPAHTLVVGAGDLVGAAPLASGLFHDEPTVEVLNQMGLDVSSVGNHEFDKGRKELMRLRRGGCFPRSEDGKVGVVGKDTCLQDGNFRGARFQYLAANVVDKATGQTLFAPTALREVGGVKVGFIGVTLRSTPAMVAPAGVLGLEFLGEVATVNRWASILKAQGAAVVVVLAHQGGSTSARTVQDSTCPDFQGPIVEMADRMDAAVDVVVSGHTHQEYVCTRPDGKLVTQAGAYGRLLTQIDLTVDPLAQRVLGKAARNHVVFNGAQALQPDAQVEAIVRRYGRLSASLADMEVGRLQMPLDRRTNAAGESSLGAVVADAYLAATSGEGGGSRPAQIAFTNPGGLRADLGDVQVTYGQLFSVLPFGNTLITMDLSGQQVLRLLEQQWERPQPPGGRILAVSQGFGYAWDASKPAGAAAGTGRRVVPGSVRLHGEPLERDKLYRVTVNSFMASGSDSFRVLKGGRNLHEGDGDVAATTLYFRAKGMVPAPQPGRIERITPPNQASP